MPNRERYFVDATIPMYAVGAEHPLKEACVRLLEAIAQGKLAAVTDVGVLQEILHRYTFLGKREKAVEVAELFLAIVPEVLPVSHRDFFRALQIHRQYLRLQARDSLHAAVMYNHGLRYIFSADRHFDLLSGIARIDPAEWVQRTSET